MVQDNSLDVENIKEKQDEDNHLQQSVMRHPEWYSCKTFNGIADVLCTKLGDDPSNWKVALPREIIGPTVNWYDQVTGHPGSKRLYEQVRQLQEKYAQCWLSCYSWPQICIHDPGTEFTGPEFQIL